MSSTAPHLTVIDNRGLSVRQIAYWRQAAESEARITALQYDAAGNRVAQRDPRLMPDLSAPASLATIHSLSGQVLSTVSVDAGWQVNLPGDIDQPLHSWDGRGNHRRIEYDNQARPLAMSEHATGGESLCTERYAYGGSDPAYAAHNQCGQLIRHDDPAGTRLLAEFGLSHGILTQTRHFLLDLECPDWPEPVNERDKLHESGPGGTNRARFNALGETIEQTDAKNHRQLFSQTRDGLLHAVALQLDGQPQAKTLVSAIQ